MTSVLRTSEAIGGSVSVASVSAEPFAVGAGLLSLLYRVSLAYDGGDGPATVIVKFPIDHEYQRAIADAFVFYPREVRFYRKSHRVRRCGPHGRMPRCWPMTRPTSYW